MAPVVAPRTLARFAPVAQWIEQPPPKGQVGRSIRLRGANDKHMATMKVDAAGDLLDASVDHLFAREYDASIRWSGRGFTDRLTAVTLGPVGRQGSRVFLCRSCAAVDVGDSYTT